jgi:predicted PurR-regulated permease PerM
MADDAPLPAGPHRAELTPITPMTPGLPSGLSTFFVLAIVVAALYFARAVLVPLALAVLLSFVLAPAVISLRRLKLGRVASVVTAVFFGFSVIFAIGAIVAGQLTSLATNLPDYQRNIESKIAAVKGASPGGVFERAQNMLKDLSRELSQKSERPPPSSAVTTSRTDELKPVPVEVKQPDPAPLQVIQNIIGPLLEPLATTGIVIVFVIFILLQREDLRDRLIRLAGPRDLQRTTGAIDDAARRVSRYLLMQTIVNASYALPIGIGLSLIGVPNAALWGLLAMVLRFIPYLGPFIAAAFPLALALAVDPGWSMLLWTAALFIMVELISNNVLEPLLYGQSTGLSPMAIVLSATFWTWLWGPVGLLLSTPLTVCLVVLGRHVPQLQFLDVLLGNRAVLAPEESFYQRMLAGDPDETTETAEEYVREKPLAAFYDEVAIPALALAQHDADRGALDEERRRRVMETVALVVDNLDDNDDVAPGEEEEGVAGPRRTAPADWADGAVVIAAGRGALDEAASLMLAQLLEKRGIGTRVVSCETVATANLWRFDLTSVRLVVLSYVTAESYSHARYVCRRLRRRFSGRILVGFWTLSEEDAARRDPLAGTGADRVATSLAGAVDSVIEIARESAETPEPRVSQAAE